MLIREPLVHVTYYYLREASGDNPDRRRSRHGEFVEDAHRITQSVAGWLSMSTPPLPDIHLWELDAPQDIQPIMKASEMRGQTNASAWIGAYVLRNMLLLRVVVLRSGEHEQTTWSLLDEALGPPPTTPAWLHTSRYWCGMAPRLPEDFEDGHLIPVQTDFGVLCLSYTPNNAHLLVYPDARTESRANRFLRTLAPQLDWHTVQGQRQFETYLEHAARSTQSQQHTLDQVARAVQDWTGASVQNVLRALGPLHDELDTLEMTYAETLNDRAATHSAAQDLRALSAGYRLQLLQSGLWNAAPTVWEAQVETLAGYQQQIEADLAHIDATLQRIETMMHILQMRMTVLHSERLRLFMALIAVLGLAVLVVLVVDTDLGRMAFRLLALVGIAGIAVAIWRTRLRPGEN